MTGIESQRPGSSMSNRSEPFRRMRQNFMIDQDLSKIFVSPIPTGGIGTSLPLYSGLDDSIGEHETHPLIPPATIKTKTIAGIVLDLNQKDSAAASRRSQASARGSVLYPGDKTRPRFLVQLLRCLQEELRVTGGDGLNAGHPVRLQIYRELFDQFIQEFKTYESILSDIKNEYEACISAQDVYQASRELETLREDMQFSLDTEREKNEHLSVQMHALKSQLDVVHEDYRRVSDQLNRKETEYRAQSFLRDKVNELVEENERLQRDYGEKLREKEESLEEVRKENRKLSSQSNVSSQRIMDLEAELQNSVDMESFNQIELDLRKTQIDLENRTKEVSSQAVALAELEAKLKEKLAELRKRTDEQFPNWDYIQSMCPFSIKEWGMLCKDLDFHDTIVILCRKLGELKSKALTDKQAGDDTRADETPGEPKYFIGLGISSDIPKHLRYKGKILNRKLSKKNCSLLIKDTWEAKALYESSTPGKGTPTSVSLVEFFYMYLKKRFGTQDIIAEWAYNICEACKKYRVQSNTCALFIDVLDGVVSERVYHHQKQMIARLKDAFYRYDVTLNEGRAKGTIPKSKVPSIFEEIWGPLKTQKQIEYLTSALDSDQPGPVVTYRWLFHSDEDCMFIDVVKEQEIEIRDEYIVGLLSALNSMFKDNKLSALDYSRCINKYDPEKRKADVDRLLSDGFGTSTQEVKLRSMIEKDKFLANLRKVFVQKGSVVEPVLQEKP
ncbi:uncharacterized protein BJ171DRAFT_595969 [Polychytrium aggregatum]|uniref:uncharacterized protein n=1 Tax=Polychytrium aggregatum TaxID=110093 RepID=UPI0022FDD2B4|nr:uncharacterized protein BJ171DRAFT_595969 [Polychytrium aggregatum]KAI9208160.1 hypothetical protein BJ171DRAFT_595969 [Polychytrium aggregatum]